MVENGASAARWKRARPEEHNRFYCGTGDCRYTARRPAAVPFFVFFGLLRLLSFLARGAGIREQKSTIVPEREQPRAGAAPEEAPRVNA